jgi:thiol-disulfide isomerase/thioredoxin
MVRSLLSVLSIATVLASFVLSGCASSTTNATAAAPIAAAELASPRGDVVVVAFYGTWCPAARQMLRSVAELQAENEGRGLVVMAVAEQEDAAGAEAFAQHVGLAGPVTVDANGELARRMNLETVPALVVIGRDGVVRRVHSGYRGAQTVGAVGREVNALLTAPRPSHNRDAIASTGALR